jgi:hypothetical protein
MDFLKDFLFSESIYSSRPYYEYPFKLRFNTDSQQMVLIFLIIWKIYYYFVTNSKTTFIEEAGSTYDTYDYIVTLINTIINYFLITLIILYFLFIYIKKKLL